MNHIALLGDSIFDTRPMWEMGPMSCGSCVPSCGGLSCHAQCDGRRHDGGHSRRSSRVCPANAAIGIERRGQRCALEAGVLEERARSVGAVLDKLAAVRDRFHHKYRAMLAELRERKLAAAVCTIMTRVSRSRKADAYDCAHRNQ